jgi:hypothetical protein
MKDKTMPIVPTEVLRAIGMIPNDMEDRVILLTDLANQPFMPQRNGRKIHKSTFYRWITRGVGPDKIRLSSIKIGGSRGVTLSALEDFFHRLNQNEKADSPTLNRMNEKHLRHIDRQLNEAGI